MRGFLIDGGVALGSSGSPIVLKPRGPISLGNGIIMAQTQPRLLGILVGDLLVQADPDDPKSRALADLGLVVDASRVRETIELFFQN